MIDMAFEVMTDPTFMLGAAKMMGQGTSKAVATPSGNYADDVVENAESVTKILKPQNLMDELAQSGVKYSADNVVTVIKTPNGKLMWLEKGNDTSGLKHIMDGHTTDFAKRGIDDIPSFLNKVLQETPVKTGITKAGLYAEYLIDGKMYKVAYGTNGYVVSFYPISK